MTLTVPIFPIPKQDLSLLSYIRTASRNPLAIFSERYYHEKVITRRYFGRTQIVFNDPEAIRQVLTEQKDYYKKPIITHRIVFPMAGGGLVLAEGDTWKRQRRMLSPAYTPRNIEKLMPHFVKAIMDWGKSVQDDQPINLAQESQLLVLRIIAQSVFSVAIGHPLERDIVEGFRQYTLKLGTPHFSDTIAKNRDDFSFMPLARGRRAFKNEWFGKIDGFLTERLKQSTDASNRDVVDLLQEARDSETGEGLSREEMVDQIATLTAAGLDTTARGMFWIFYLLALAPQWQEVIREEVNAVPDLFEAPTLEKLERLKKTKAVWQEVLRLYPTNPFMVRQALRAHRVMDTDVPKDALVGLIPWIMHRHHAYWDSPEQFRPERFYDNRTIPKGVYIPFGVGPRICIGATFSFAEGMLILAAVVKRWHIVLADRKPVLPVMMTATLPSYDPMFRLQPVKANKEFQAA